MWRVIYNVVLGYLKEELTVTSLILSICLITSSVIGLTQTNTIRYLEENARILKLELEESKKRENLYRKTLNQIETLNSRIELEPKPMLVEEKKNDSRRKASKD